MRLEIKHLAPYLPNQPFIYFGVLAGYEMIYPVLGYQPHKILTYEDGNRGNRIWMDLEQFQYHRLALHPLSSLTKPITHKGEAFVPMVELLTLAYPTNDYSGRYGLIDFDTEGYPMAWFRYAAHRSLMIRTSEMESIQTWITNKLHEWMFDTNGLIESGLAIDVTTLTENPYAK